MSLTPEQLEKAAKLESTMIEIKQEGARLDKEKLKERLDDIAYRRELMRIDEEFS
mgnify:CR=1 FL=1